jgi:hypothetical protein
MYIPYTKWYPLSILDVHTAYIRNELPPDILTHDNCIFIFVRFYKTITRISKNEYIKNVREQEDILKHM